MAVAQDRNAVGNGKDFIQAVRDEDHGHAITFQVTNNVEQQLRLPVRQRGRRFVHDHKLRPETDSSGNFNHLLLCNRHAEHLAAHIHFNVELLEQLFGVFVHLGPVNQAVFLFGLTSNENVFCDAQTLENIQLLINDRQSEALCVSGIVNLRGFSAKFDRSAIAGIGAGKDFHECGFTGTIFAGKRKNLALLDVKIDMIQRFDAWERLTYVPQHKDVFIHR